MFTGTFCVDVNSDLFLHSQQTKLPQPCRRAACRTLKAAELFARLEKPLHLQQVFKCSRVEFLPQTAVALLLLTYVMLQFVFFFLASLSAIPSFSP